MPPSFANVITLVYQVLIARFYLGNLNGIYSYHNVGLP